MSITVRPATREDVPVLADFNIGIAFETEGKHLPPAVITAGVAGIFDNPSRGFYIVAEIDGELAGCTMITYEWSDWRAGDFWWIQSVYVTPKHRRKGVFRALYNEVKRQAESTPGVCGNHFFKSSFPAKLTYLAGLRLYVDADNKTAQNSYSSLGMEESRYKFFELEFHHHNSGKEDTDKE
eukprot:GILI01047335.1.p1 GENE.GILI01047335.1~~GILI01047335.1.p1  ORF type:complete len:181 (+),score=16.57 GILI01047335.1:31-573(+)